MALAPRDRRLERCVSIDLATIRETIEYIRDDTRRRQQFARVHEALDKVLDEIEALELGREVPSYERRKGQVIALPIFFQRWRPD